MSDVIQAVRGMPDILPEEISYWQFLEIKLRDLMARYGYQEIRFPILEEANLFARSVGEGTDIVEKETYTFVDRNGDQLTLRPEGTAGCVRAVIQHNLLQVQSIQRLWYMGPMFRHERPQKGRYRQFHQFGIEVFGIPTSDIEIELLLLTVRLWQELKLDNFVKLQINSLGSPVSRATYRESLVAYLKDHYNQLDEDSQRRLEKNPFRILDTKNPATQALLINAPNMKDYWDVESQEQFNQICEYLDKVGVVYEIQPRLVRGLDYYTGLVFEWVTDHLGAQGTVCAGGRYDKLIEELGGPSSTATGLALGIERLILLLKEQHITLSSRLDVYLLNVGQLAKERAIIFAEELRTAIPSLHVMLHGGGGNFKNQFKKADKSGARLALILGEEEIEKQQVTIKYLREEREQTTIPQTEVVKLLKVYLSI